MEKIFQYDWFSNRNELGKFKFDKSKAIYDFSNTSVSKTLWGKNTKVFIKNFRKLEAEFGGINRLINKHKFITITVNPSDKENLNYASEDKIVISGKPIKDLGERGLDIALGAMVHEASHIRFTNFELSKKKKINSQCLHWIWNLIEDEIIEEMLQLEKPGLGNVLGPIKDYMFKSDKLNSDSDEIDKILYILFAIIRYPINLKNVPEDILNKYSDLFEKIYKILQKNNVLNISIKSDCSSENLKAATEIYNLLNKKFNLPPSDSGCPCENGQKQGENGKPNNSQNPLDEKFDKNGKPKNLSDIENSILGESTMESFDNSDKKQIEAKIQKAEFDKKLNKINPEDESSERGNAPSNFLRKINYYKKDKNHYDELKNKIKPYIKYVKNIQIKKAEKEMVLCKHEYMKNGTLTGRTLASAFQGEKNVYTQLETKINKEKLQKFAVILALDESGSMSPKQIRDLVSGIAIIFTEAYNKNNNIELFVYGHSDEIVNYINPKSKDFYSLGNRYQGGGQNEVYAYNTIIKDVLKQTNSDILLINITDAQYLSNYKDIEKELAKWEKNIYQSLIVVNNKLNNNDKKMNNKIYGENNWAHIVQLEQIDKNIKEFKKLISHINVLSKKALKKVKHI